MHGLKTMDAIIVGMHSWMVPLLSGHDELAVAVTMYVGSIRRIMMIHTITGDA